MSRPRVLLTGASGFIGTNLVDALEERADVVNLDVSRPFRRRHEPYWRECDILDRGAVMHAFSEVRPRYVVHLAARTDCDEDTTVEEGYAVNTTGTANVLAAVSGTPSVARLVVTSTQYVSGPEHTPTHDEDFGPHTVYGASKVVTEQLTRGAGLTVPWTIIRPVNIWGPWHERYRAEFWRVAARGLYVHPAGPPVLRTYGYVGNVVWQIGRILTAPSDFVSGRVLYVGDRPIDVFDWADAFCRALRGRGARRVPRSALRLLGLAGDVLGCVGVTFPLTTSRFRNMIGDYAVDMERTFDLLGVPPIGLEQGVAESVAWLRAMREGRGEDWELIHRPDVAPLDVDLPTEVAARGTDRNPAATGGNR